MSSNITSIIILLLLVLQQKIQIVQSSGKIYIRFIYYKNPKGHDSNGNSCDWISNACDPKFKIKTTISGVSPHEIETDHKSDTNYISFGNQIINKPNPLVYSFGSYTYASLSVQVIDVDAVTSYDPIDYFTLHITQGPTANAAFSAPQEYLLYGESIRTELAVQITITCDINYYGSDCSKFCIPRNDNINGHYTCSSMGDKVCLDKWSQSSSCKTTYCYNNDCKNNARCIDLAKSYICDCIGLFKGSKCDLPLAPCEKNIPCRNGGTCISSKGCNCLPNYNGTSCELDVNECQMSSNLCKNNGTCVNQFGSYSCQCSVGWQGSNCEQDVNECNAPHTCFYNAKCVNLPGSYRCNCTKGFTGHRCQEDVNECELNQHNCSDRELCQNTLGSYVCLCKPQYTGSNCEMEIQPEKIQQSEAEVNKLFIILPCILIVLLIVIAIIIVVVRRKGYSALIIDKANVLKRRLSQPFGSSDTIQRNDQLQMNHLDHGEHPYAIDNGSYRMDDENYEKCEFEHCQNFHTLSTSLSVSVISCNRSHGTPPPLPPKSSVYGLNYESTAPSLPPRNRPSVYDLPDAECRPQSTYLSMSETSSTSPYRVSNI